MANNLETASATLQGLETLATALVEEAQERNRANVQEMYHALWWIVHECCEPNPDINFIQRCAERAIKRT